VRGGGGCNMPRCHQNILKIITDRPITFTQLSKKSNCAYETVNKYVTILEDEQKIKTKQGKFKIFYNPALETKKLEFYELMLNVSISITVMLLLNSKNLPQNEIEAKISKSRPTVSRTLSTLRQNGIIGIQYHAPFKTYYIKDKPKITSWIKETHPDMVNSKTDNLVEMFNY